ncbi:hypothetical protein ANN_19421 [Periplaneta americana]|uniref:Uncharacterized protein n=1 Tax=Periplaneta americana TaxID=6978 RepID=A0ABQ8SAR3_PERAM|nr:hypothetical protein ANN_19421 [Periplaneta americana]
MAAYHNQCAQAEKQYNATNWWVDVRVVLSSAVGFSGLRSPVRRARKRSRQAVSVLGLQHTASDILSQTGRFCLGTSDVTVITYILIRPQHTASDILSQTGRFCLGPSDVTVITYIRLQHIALDILSQTGRFRLGSSDVTVTTYILIRLQHTASDILSQTGRFCLGTSDVTATTYILIRLQHTASDIRSLRQNIRCSMLTALSGKTSHFTICQRKNNC